MGQSLAHFHLLLVLPLLVFLPPDELLPSFELVPDSLGEEGAAGGSLNIDGIEIAFEVLVEGDSVLKGISLRALEELFLLDVGVGLAVAEELLADFGEVLFAHGHFGEEAGLVAVGVGGGGHEALPSVGVGPVVGELVVVHLINLLELE